MDWSQFLDPQVVLGMGAFAVGVINAYWSRRRTNQQNIPEGGVNTDTNPIDPAMRSRLPEDRLIPIEGFIEDDGRQIIYSGYYKSTPLTEFVSVRKLVKRVKITLEVCLGLSKCLFLKIS